jgi:hypothetical protein
VSNTEEQQLYMYEMDYYNGQECYVVDYDAMYYNNDTETLTVEQETFYGVTKQEEYTALDITQLVQHVDIEYIWWSIQTDERLTPCTLMRHLTGATDKITWTCSGMVQALIGMDRTGAYYTPLTPDQLLSYCRTKIS